MIKALIIDDESDSREVIRTIVEEYCPNVQIVGEADNAETAYKMISTLQPNLLFLGYSNAARNWFRFVEKV